MKRTLAFAILVASLIVLQADADVPPPSRKSDVVHSVSPVRVVGIKEHADYVFYFRWYTSTRGNPLSEPPSHFELKEGETIQPTGAYRFAGESIVAVPRKTYDAYKAAPNLQWLRDGVPGMLTVNVPSLRLVTAKEPRKLPVVEFRVTLKEGKLQAEKISKDPPLESSEQSDARESYSAPEARMWPWMAALAATFSALSLATMGVWWARRRQLIR